MNVQWIEKHGDFLSPFDDPYRLIVICNDKEMENCDIERISDQITETPVTLVAAWGSKCSYWDDAIDWSYIAKNIALGSDVRHVTTTWHENESIPDVLEFVRELHTDGDMARENIHLVVIGSGLVPLEELKVILAEL
jgi:hypothetical protein